MKKYKVKKKQPKPKKVEHKPLQNQVEQKSIKSQASAIEKRNNNSVQKHIEKLKKAGQKKEQMIKT